MAAAFAFWSVASLGSAIAQVTGHLRLVVKDAAGATPLAGAKVTFRDTLNEKPTVESVTDAEGTAVSPPLENRDWEVKVESGGNLIMSQIITVVADTVTDVDVLAPSEPAAPGEPPKPKVNVLRQALTVIEAIRTKNFAALFPMSPGNTFSLENLLKSVPGFVSGANGQVFARGDQNFGTILLDGLRMPESFFGAFTNNINGNIIANFEAMTGGLPPEFAGLASSVINVNLRGGTLEPKNGINIFGGTFATFDGSIVLTGQTGRAMGEPDPSGRVNRNLAYFVNLADRRTDNSSQSPQPDEQEANNNGGYNNFFGNFDYRPNLKDQWNLLLNIAPGRTDVANRTGLGSNWPTGGYGFGGLFAPGPDMPSQEGMGIDVHNRADNNFGLLSWRRNENPNTDWMLSFGAANVGLDQGHDSPGIDLMNLPLNSSQEYNPNIGRTNRSWQSQGHYRRKTGKHDVKFGYFIEESDGRESYQLIPGSVIALDVLMLIDPRLAPPSNPVAGAFDPLGNPMWTPTGAPAPVLRSDTSRHNRSFFVQDDWVPSDRFSANFGARWDSYKAGQSLGFSSVSRDEISPRVNLSYKYDHRTVIRAAYNRLFQPPPLVQGELIGMNPTAALSDQLDLSFERTLGPTSSMKFTAYQKSSEDQLYIQQLIPYLQEGPFSGINIDKSYSRGIEVSAIMTPVNNLGISGFLTWTNSVARTNRRTSMGEEAPEYLPADQRNSITAGLNYMWQNGANWALTWDYGSGLPSADIFMDGERRQQSRFNFRFQSGGTAFGPLGGFTVDVENLFDSNTVIGFNSPVNGTRFQQGRRITISAFSQFLTR
jgi:outer membrane receptor protein involved in Fe transport